MEEIREVGEENSKDSEVEEETSVADPDTNPDPPDPPDPRVFGPPGSGSGSFYYHAKIVRKTLIPTIF
jgi:hypothetical protein